MAQLSIMSTTGAGGGVSSAEFMLWLSLCVFFLVCPCEYPGRLGLSRVIAIQPHRVR